MPTITISVDQSLCIGAASCVQLAPERFVLNDDNQAVLLTPMGRASVFSLEVTEEERKRVLAAAQSCPTVAITIVNVP